MSLKIITLLKNKRKGFTLLESLVVISITSLILLTLLWGTRVFNRQINSEPRFWQSFAVAWNQTLVTAKIQQTPAWVTLAPHQAVCFETYLHQRLIKHEVRVPTGLSVTSWHEIKISKNGTVSPQTITWRSEASRRWILQKIQLGWGCYHNEIKSF
ncbi:hypothetical protein B808_1248 [Fructilactobacillus florum 8D]|uniref:Prepilin-type N-terminal cleavage/methylation domain-containing protein n=2 Tax=Fructilactobacillus florum TaxID=640331 RepID=W9ECY8_9LACO|nr:prepilin-type N-terminal cleavage/methylation domain-containing protein [Fructilactobacillus florum]EKK20934.1 hypothetical protein B807_344 [Fructilactobacillus florum 2F]ETO39917.1 hypothetical protein B808_1248 [Fructilactobacillus florum 8D]KRM91616.1 hypothetical protein FC87_GL000750 [Fructilactobacillus florum DSM 22689 = JCM 16035]